MSWVGSQGLTLAAQVKVGALQAFVAETTHISIAIVAFDTVVRVANTVTAGVLRRRFGTLRDGRFDLIHSRFHPNLSIYFLHLMANLSLLYNEDLKFLQFKLPGSIRRSAAADGRVHPL